MRLHELARPVLEQLVAEAGPSGWAAVLRGLVDTVLANRQLFVLHQRNDLADLSPEVYGDLLREAITDLLQPRGDGS